MYCLILPTNDVSVLFAERYGVMVVDDAVNLTRYLACENISVRRVPRLPIGIMDIYEGKKGDARTRACIASTQRHASKSSVLRSARRHGITSSYLNLLIERYQWTRAPTVPSLNSLRLDWLRGNSATVALHLRRRELFFDMCISFFAFPGKWLN